MFIVSVKASTLRFFATLCIALILITCLVIFMPSNESVAVFADDGTVIYTNAKTNEGRIAFLQKFGWTVSQEPVSTTEVTIPTEFDSVFIGYNDLQKLQGLDLTKYKRKNVTRYTYTVTNYENYQGTVYANLLIYRGRVIGGDICTEATDGFIHGFSKNTRL